MKKMDFRNLMTALVGAVINRSVLLMMNPFGIAYFAGAYMYKPGRPLLVLAVIIGHSASAQYSYKIRRSGSWYCYHYQNTGSS